MSNFFKDSNIPGGAFLKWIIISLIIIPLVTVLVVDDSETLNKILKILVIILDSVCLYMVIWILAKDLFSKYYQLVLAITVIAIGETMMVFL